QSEAAHGVTAAGGGLGGGDGAPKAAGAAPAASDVVPADLDVARTAGCRVAAAVSVMLEAAGAAPAACDAAPATSIERGDRVSKATAQGSPAGAGAPAGVVPIEMTAGDPAALRAVGAL